MSRIDEALRRAAELGETNGHGVDGAPPAPALLAETVFELEPALSDDRPAEPDVSADDIPLRVPFEAAIEPPLELRAAADMEAKSERPDAAAAEPSPEPATEPVAEQSNGSRTEREAASRPASSWTRVPHDKLVVSEEIKPVAVEQYRRAATVLHQMQGDRDTRVVMVASAIAGEGKTLTACNVSLTLSESFGRRVLLVDADLRRPSVHSMFKLRNESGLNEALRAARPHKLPIAEVSPRLSVLTAGRSDPDPMSILSSARMRALVAEASAKFDWVVLDTPPIALLPDANLLAESADVVLLVIGAGSTPLRLIERAVKALDRDRIAGVILNRVCESGPTYAYYRQYAHYAARRERTGS